MRRRKKKKERVEGYRVSEKRKRSKCGIENARQIFRISRENKEKKKKRKKKKTSL